MADSNRMQMSMVRETTFGATPSASLDEIPITGGGLPQGHGSIRSNTIRTDAQRAGMERTSEEPSASYDFEFAATTYDEWLRGALRSDADWSTAVSLSGTDISAAASPNQYAATSTDLTTNVTNGQWVFVAGFTTAANNGWSQVTSTTSTTMVVTNRTLSVEAAGDSVTIKGSQIINGTDDPSYSIQQQYLELTDRYHIATGMVINSLGLALQPNGIITGSIAFDGQDRAQAASKAGDGTVTAAAVKSVMNEGVAVGETWIKGALVTYDWFGVSVDINTPLRPRKPLGSTTRTAIKQGAMEVSGSLALYMDDNTWTVDTDHNAFTPFMIAFDLVEGSDRYLIHIPQVVVTAEPNAINGPDSDIMLELEWEAEPLAHYTGGSVKTIQICRV